MTVASTVVRAAAAWTGAETEIPTGIQVQERSQLVVSLVPDEGERQALTLGLHYTITLSPAGVATVVPLAAFPAKPGTVSMVRQTPMTQVYDPTATDTYDAEGHAAALDRSAMRVAELSQKVDDIAAATIVVVGGAASVPKGAAYVSNGEGGVVAGPNAGEIESARDAAVSSAGIATSKAAAAAASAAAAALFDPANFYLKTDFRSDSTANAPVKYDAAGGFVGKWMTLSQLGKGAIAGLNIQGDTGHDAHTFFYDGTTLKYRLGYKADDGSFNLWSYAAAGWGFFITSSLVPVFSKPPLIGSWPLTAWDVELREQQVGSYGGASNIAANTWGVRALNTYVINSIGSTFNSTTNEVTIPPGQYIAEWDAIAGPSVTSTVHKTRLYNSTAGSVIDYGTAEFVSQTSGNWMALSRSFGHAMFTITVQSKIRLEHISTGPITVGAGGSPMADGSPNIYANLRLRKVQ